MSNEKLKFPSNFASEQFVEYIGREEIDHIIESLAHTISQNYHKKELVLVGVLKGSCVFLADLARKIKDVKIYIDFVKVASVGRDKENDGTIVLEKDISTNILGRNVLIVEEIIDTGRALHFLKNRLMAASPNNVEVITLFDKPYQRAVPIKADYIGKKIDDQFIIGYGLDLDSYGRNVADIFYLKYPN